MMCAYPVYDTRDTRHGQCRLVYSFTYLSANWAFLRWGLGNMVLTYPVMSTVSCPGFGPDIMEVLLAAISLLLIEDLQSHIGLFRRIFI